MTQPTFTIGVFAVILDNENQVLLCHRRDYDLWNLPGGGLEHGESPQKGVLREVKEEVGLEVEIERLAGVYSKPDKNELVLSFICSIKSGQPTISDEVDQIDYFSYDNIPHNTSPKQKERIKDVLDGKQCIMKTQSGRSSIELIKEGNL